MVTSGDELVRTNSEKASVWCRLWTSDASWWWTREEDCGEEERGLLLALTSSRTVGLADSYRVPWETTASDFLAKHEARDGAELKLSKDDVVIPPRTPIFDTGYFVHPGFTLEKGDLWAQSLLHIQTPTHDAPTHVTLWVVTNIRVCVRMEPTETVLDLRQRIAGRIGVDHRLLSVLWKSGIPSDDQTIAEAGFEDHAEVEIVLELRGGAEARGGSGKREGGEGTGTRLPSGREARPGAWPQPNPHRRPAPS